LANSFCLVRAKDDKWKEFSELFRLLGGNFDEIGNVFDIEDSTMQHMFEGYRTTIHRQHHSSPLEFKRDHHRQRDGVELRERYLEHLEGNYAEYELQGSEEGKCRVLPVVHGTKEFVAWKIAHGGFGIVAGVDAGFYGQGIYFSSAVDYVKPYSHPTSTDYSSVLVISLVTPGNAFPVTEAPGSEGSLLGSKCQLGYQSHYVVVTGDGKPALTVTPQSVNEVVVFQSAQVFPKFIVYLKGATFRPSQGACSYSFLLFVFFFSD